MTVRTQRIFGPVACDAASSPNVCVTLEPEQVAILRSVFVVNENPSAARLFSIGIITPTTTRSLQPTRSIAAASSVVYQDYIVLNGDDSFYVGMTGSGTLYAWGFGPVLVNPT